MDEQLKKQIKEAIDKGHINNLSSLHTEMYWNPDCESQARDNVLDNEYEQVNDDSETVQSVLESPYDILVAHRGMSTRKKVWDEHPPIYLSIWAPELESLYVFGRFPFRKNMYEDSNEDTNGYKSFRYTVDAMEMVGHDIIKCTLGKQKYHSDETVRNSSYQPFIWGGSMTSYIPRGWSKEFGIENPPTLEWRLNLEIRGAKIVAPE